MSGPQPKPGILEIEAYVPGKSAAPGVLSPAKLSANENAFGCSPLARAAYLGVAPELSLYPDMKARALRDAIADKYAIEADRLIFGAGSDELFALACQTYLAPGDNAIQPEFGFSAWAIAARAAGGVIKNAPEKDFRVDIDEILARVDARTRIVFVANPANPTGTEIPFSDVKSLHHGLRPDILLIIDGAYSEFASGGYAAELALAAAAPNILVTKTFSKIFGLAGLRIGWGYAATDVIAALDRVRPPFNTTRAGQAAAAAALRDDAFVRKSVDYVVAARSDLARFLEDFGLTVIPSAANFVTALFGAKMPLSASEAESALTARGVLVRGLKNYGLENGLRITIGAPGDLERFRSAFCEIMG